MTLELVRATPENGIFDRLKTEWDIQLEHDDAPAGVYVPMMEHAAKVCSEYHQAKGYSIFVVLDTQPDGTVVHEGLIHINHIFPGTKAPTLRLIWNLIAPRYAYEEVNPKHIASILSTFLAGALKLASDTMPSKEVKMYLGNAIDRTFAEALVKVLGAKIRNLKFAIHGGWLHIEMR